jgi:hypothetical protein
MMRALLVLGLVIAAWTLGRAQASTPSFELLIDAPEGRTNIECVRGCKLAWVQRGVPSNDTARQATFTYSCTNSPTDRCGSGRIGGWVD